MSDRLDRSHRSRLGFSPERCLQRLWLLRRVLSVWRNRSPPRLRRGYSEGFREQAGGQPEPLPDAAGRSNALSVTTGKKAGSFPPAPKFARPNRSCLAGSTIFARGRAQRVQQLNADGYDDAQLYDPQETSVRGIHAFFLLLGEPEAYGLPPKPEVPTIYLKSAWTSAIATAIGALIATLCAFYFL